MNNATGYFVTGTDTEIGKTVVSAALIRALVQRGHKTVGMKPVASGCEETDHGLRNEDALHLMDAASVECAYDDVNPFSFVPPIAPHIAAEEAGVTIDFDHIRNRCEKLSSMAERIVVEGVGGWTVPLGNGHSVAGLAAMLGLPVVLVVGMRLGCLNHALLTAESIQHAGVPCAGWVANELDGTMARLDKNIRTLEAQMPFPMIARVPPMDDPYKRSIDFAIE